MQVFFHEASVHSNKSTPTENRTPVSGLRVLRPRPLDDRGIENYGIFSATVKTLAHCSNSDRELALHVEAMRGVS